MTKLLEVLNLSKSFGGITAVDHVSFELAAGQLNAMIGPNGAGKSTCFNLINGQLRPDHGSIKINGRETAGLTPRQIWKLGVGRTFQLAATFSSMTVLENVQMGLLSYYRQTKSPFQKVENLHIDESLELINLVGLEGRHGHVCGAVSYADLKRIELAVALTSRPRLLLMDEPTAGMAPAERRSLMEMIAAIACTRNMGILFTEHDMDVVFTHADRVMVLNRGQLIVAGTPAVVRENDKVQQIYLGPGA